MASFSFVLKSPNQIEPSLIYMMLRHNGKSKKLSTGLKVTPKDWDKKKQRIRDRADIVERTGNLELKRLSGEFEKYSARCAVDEKDFKFDEFKRVIRGEENSQSNGEHNLVRFAETYISESLKSYETKRSYRRTLELLNEFAGGYSSKLDFNDWDHSMFNAFETMLEEHGYSDNTIGVHVKNWKVFMRESKDREYHKNPIADNRRIKTRQEFTPQIYLTEEEIQRIMALDLDHAEHLDRARDLFVLQSWVGVRFSDLHKISKETLSQLPTGDYCFRIRMKKTGGFVVIPVLSNQVHEILDKYDGHSPMDRRLKGTVSDTTYNRNIKIVAELAGIDEEVVTYRTHGGKRKEFRQPKHELVASHTARRSFASNAYKKVDKPISIMAVTGHKTEASFLKYIRLTGEEHALELLKKS